MDIMDTAGVMTMMGIMPRVRNGAKNAARSFRSGSA